MAIFSRPNREYLDLFYHFFVKNSTSYLPIGLYPCAAGQSTLGGKRWGRRLRRDAGKALGGRLRRRRDWRSRAGGKGCGGIKSGRSDEWEHNKKGPTDRKNPSDLFTLRQRMGTGAGAARLFGMWRGLFHGEGEKHPARALEGFGLSRRVSLIPTRWLPGAWGRGRTARGRRRGPRPGYAG